jgi:hypothetical protein
MIDANCNGALRRIPGNLGFKCTDYQVSSTNLSPSLFVLEYTNQNTTMASSGGPEAEYDDPHRKELIEALKDALFVDTVQQLGRAFGLATLAS